MPPAGRFAGVDLWNYLTPDGRSIRQAIEFLIPVVTGEERFPYEQITEFRPPALHPVLRAAAVSFNELRYLDRATDRGSTLRLN